MTSFAFAPSLAALGFVLDSSAPWLVLTRTLCKSANLLIVGFAVFDVFKEARLDGVIVVLRSAAARVLQVQEWF